MIGNPKYKEGDIVTFTIETEDGTSFDLVGEVYIVDAFGTFEQNEQPSYDIMVEHSHFDGKRCLYKHLIEQNVFLKNQK